ncbi:alpha/beta hydrolase family protein [Chryseobacterium wanjuense]|nr:prolyl oligopeptidase family serine peptidase [Chryseobacterium wanjuense]
MKKLIWIYVLLFTGISIPAQDRKDTLQSWMSKFYRLTNPVLSEGGKWAAVRKRYDISQDTLIVVNTSKPRVPATTLALDGTVSFLKDDGLLISGAGKAKFLDLKSGAVKHYDNIRSAYPLPKSSQYALLTKDAVLSIYSIDGKLQHRITEIQGLPVTDDKGNLYICKLFENSCEIWIISGKKQRKLYIIEYAVKEMEVSPSGLQVFVMGQDSKSSDPRMSIIDTQNGRSVSLTAPRLGDESFFNVTRVQNGKALFIALYGAKKAESELVDIWYGNDDKLDAKKRGSRKGRFWLWKLGSDHIDPLPDDVYPEIASLNSERYFLAYSTQGHNFITLQPQFMDASIYDAKQKKYSPLGALKGVTYGSPEVICSKNGMWILFSEKRKKWTIFDLAKKEKHLIDQTGLRNPVFSDDNRLVLFESEKGLWEYDIVKKSFFQSHIAGNKAVSMVNVADYKTSYNSQIGIRSFETKKPLLLEIKERGSDTSYYILKGKNLEVIMPPIKDKVGRLTYNDRLTHFLTLEENFNKPPQLYIKSEGQKQLLLDGGSSDSEAPLLKQDIIHYATTDGRSLKGILYYPVGYKPHQKYPMVVYIYQIQSEKSNEYMIPGYHNSDGLDIRTLIQKGYFVLLPDTAVGPAGPGLSALDCVHKALDAVGQNPNIDMKKVGLVGHSFGGYETNFIATHSDRFETYISGSGISDITRSYFSYNYHFPGPYYWQYETGQFEMNYPFSENKAIYFDNNPIIHVDKVKVPILLWTGKQDENVPWDQTTEFFIGLKRNGKPVIAIFYPNGRHAFAYNSIEKKDLYIKVMEWWDYFLKDKKNVTWIDKQMKKGAL